MKTIKRVDLGQLRSMGFDSLADRIEVLVLRDMASRVRSITAAEIDSAVKHLNSPSRSTLTGFRLAVAKYFSECPMARASFVRYLNKLKKEVGRAKKGHK
jgi:hypothetical protein